MADLSLYSLEAEGSVLGGLLINPSHFAEVAELIVPADFVDEQHSALFSAMAALEAKGRRIDPLTLADQLEAAGEPSVGVAWIGKLMANTPGAGNILAYAQIVRERAQLRRVIRALKQCEGVIADTTLALGARAEKCADHILQAVDTSEAKYGRSVRECGRDWVAQLERIHAAGSSIIGLRFGFPALDQATKGMLGGELVIVGAKPSMGKTNFLLNVFSSIASTSGSVYLATLESPESEIMNRLAAANSFASYDAIQEARMDEIGDSLAAFASRMRDWKFTIDDRAAQTVASLRAGALRHRRQHGSLDAIGVDYLQLLEGRGKDRYEIVTNISRDLKKLAMELKVPVIVLSQLSREVEKRADKRPMMSDLRESGQIEQDAGIILFLYRDVVYNPQTPHPLVAECIIAKLKRGKLCTVPLVTRFDHCKFASVEHGSLPENWQGARQPRGRAPL